MPVLLLSDTEAVSRIRCLLSDVDGVMTDGGIVYDSALRETKRFHVRDGLGIRVWMASGSGFGIITARSSEIVSHRAAELGIEEVSQGRGDKRQAAIEMSRRMGYEASEVAYIGDDLPDLPVMRWCGLAAAPSDAAADAREAAHWVLNRRGGEGAVREFIERMLRAQGRWGPHVPN